MSKPIVVQTTKAVGSIPKGAELGYDSEAKATSVLGEDAFKVVRYQDGAPFQPTKKASKSASKEEK